MAKPRPIRPRRLAKPHRKHLPDDPQPTDLLEVGVRQSRSPLPRHRPAQPETAPPMRDRWFADSPLEGNGFELSVPRAITRDGNLLAADRHLICNGMASNWAAPPVAISKSNSTREQGLTFRSRHGREEFSTQNRDRQRSRPYGGTLSALGPPESGQSLKVGSA